VKFPTLKSLFELAVKQEDMAPRRHGFGAVVGYDKDLDDMYKDEDEEENKSLEDFMIRRVF
jgi:hypothetical protein